MKHEHVASRQKPLGARESLAIFPSPDEVTDAIPDGEGAKSLCHPHGLASPAVPSKTCGMSEK